MHDQKLPNFHTEEALNVEILYTLKSHRNYVVYRRIKYQCTKPILRAKVKFEQKIVDNMKVDTKSFWTYIKDQTKSKTGIYDLKNKLLLKVKKRLY